jgi:DNA-binding beta-propeller fold protein YncE
VAFVHTLSLHDGWAHCVPLPTVFWGGDSRHEAMVSSPYGDELFVVDTQRGSVAVMDIVNLAIARRAKVDFGSVGSDQTHATLTPDGGTLLVSNGSTVTRLDASSLKPLGPAWPMSHSVRGLGFSKDGLRLYAAMPDEVAVLDPATGQELRMFTAPGVRDIHYVDTLAA